MKHGPVSRFRQRMANAQADGLLQAPLRVGSPGVRAAGRGGSGVR